MDIILLERVEKLGQMGQVVKVRPGYARNFLLPQKKALRATKANLAFFETQKAQLEAQNLERRKDAEQVAGKMKGVSVIITRQAAESGMLYGSVNGRDISEAVTEAGYTVERNQVAISDPIKSLGLYDIRVILHPEVSVNVRVNVARTLEEAQMQAQRGGMVSTADLLAEEEEAEAAAEAAAAAADEEDENA
ncbi:50S ribosomal protein L9 [Skermanella stibiiresistens SB22]|jgi:large subunit ribosomal protein L9|uniref:Large ribosomal subunit protein bL9 n=1 Tax=Skermanella stibiiresistens SB22 TaxID=1385369 RepID=W9H861_9PROT|nr:50S ribosomal protein L9 [Skermanella stibiiresistens]EWY39993.1 50S ribosomal protein L9 [Skermanella stibiiresistens SB22]